MTKSLVYWVHLKVMKKMKCCKCDSRDLIHDTLFPSKITNRSNKLECYIALGWKGLPMTKTLV
jgi:hypothetical protein